MNIKSFAKKRPILSVFISLALICLIGYVTLVLIVLRPINMSNERMSSYDRSWSDIEANVNKINIGISVDSVKLLLGEPDDTHSLNNGSTTIYSYQQYGVVAPHWVYDIHISNDTVLKIESYDW